MIRVSAFRWVPPFARGLVRDLRVRWALEEAGLAYEERLIGPEDQTSDSYRRLQPFGQVPTYEEDGAADLLMTTVLRILRHTDLLEKEPTLLAYKERCEARPAFVKALTSQMAVFATQS